MWSHGQDCQTDVHLERSPPLYDRHCDVRARRADRPRPRLPSRRTSRSGQGCRRRRRPPASPHAGRWPPAARCVHDAVRHQLTGDDACVAGPRGRAPRWQGGPPDTGRRGLPVPVPASARTPPTHVGGPLLRAGVLRSGWSSVTPRAPSWRRPGARRLGAPGSRGEPAQGLGGGPPRGVLAEHHSTRRSALVVLAIVLAVCSEADAFVAASCTQFSRTAQLAFMVVGPVVDVKLVALPIGTFARRFAARFSPLALVTAVACSVLAGCPCDRPHRALRSAARPRRRRRRLAAGADRHPPAIRQGLARSALVISGLLLVAAPPEPLGSLPPRARERWSSRCTTTPAAWPSSRRAWTTRACVWSASSFRRPRRSGPSWPRLPPHPHRAELLRRGRSGRPRVHQRSDHPSRRHLVARGPR